VTSTQVYSLLVLTALIAALVGALSFAVLRFIVAAREARSRAHGAGAESTFITTMLQETARLRDLEREARARAEACERLSHEIIAGIGSGLMLVEPGGAVRVLNPSGARLLGLAGRDAAGLHVRELLTEAGAAPLADVVEEALRTGQAITRRSVTLPPRALAGDQVMHLGVTVSPVVNAQRNGQAVICLFTDLTEVVAREEQIRVKESLARVGELTAGLAHEFRNGLATIHGYAWMLDPDALPDEPGTFVKGIRDETDALGKVVTNFLGFARPTQLALVTVDLGAVLRGVAGEWRPEVERLGGRIEVSGEFLPIDGDEVLLHQAFDNLCRNAIDACRDAQRAPAIAITGRQVPADRQVVVVVSDNGPGIDAASRARIFQPFYTTRPGGTGLGLALVQKIIVTHNGRVSVSSGPDGGAAFEVRLPVEASTFTRV
jgi:PAS domain S-box-containing protein